MNNCFKYDLETLYKEVNTLVMDYQKEDTSKIQKEFILSDLLKLTEQIVKNNCKKFIRKYTITDISEEELYAVAIAHPLLDALKWFNFEKGNNFLAMWHYFMKRRFCNELKEINTKKATYYRNNVSSADKVLGEDGTSTICDLVGQGDFADAICEKITLSKLIDEFEKVDKHGKLIRCFAINNQKEKTEAFLHVLGADTYGAVERKQVERVKKKFKTYALAKGYTF